MSDEVNAEASEHMIIWLDDHIGDQKYCRLLKETFASHINPQFQICSNLTDLDFDNLIRNEDARSLMLNGVLFLIKPFKDASLCFEALKYHRNKRIFFITSASLGQVIIPKIIEEIPEIFTDPYTNNPLHHIYIFCAKIEENLQLADRYKHYVLMFDHEADLLIRIVRDTAIYFLTLGQISFGKKLYDRALLCYQSSKKLYLHCQRLGESVEHKMKEIDKFINDIEKIIRQNPASSDFSRYDPNEDYIAEQCS